MRIGVAGIGKMGAAIAARLMEVGHEVAVWNRTPDKAKAVAGATAVATPSDLARRSEAVITILTDGAAIDAVYNGPAGLLSGDVTGKLFIEMSTVPPKVETALAPKVEAKNAVFVECPVGGSTTPARQGKLLGLLGGDAAAAARALPILNQLCRKVEHCGPVGAGSSMKLAINLPLMVAWQAYGEAFAIARDVGWEPKRLLDLFVESNGANNGLKMRADMIVAMMENRDPGPTTFNIADAVKDLRTMVDTGAAKGADMPATRAALSAFEEANKRGLGGGDGARQAVYWASRARAITSQRFSFTQRIGATMSVISLSQASTIVDVALKKARDTNLAPLTVAVLDAGGHLVAFKREDKSGLLRYDIAYGKAWGALGMGFGSRTLATRAGKTPQFFTMLAAASGGRMVTNPGGVLIRDAGGNVIGACGISGDTSDKDEMCAIAGIEAAGLKADPGAD